MRFAATKCVIIVRIFMHEIRLVYHKLDWQIHVVFTIINDGYRLLLEVNSKNLNMGNNIGLTTYCIIITCYPYQSVPYTAIIVYCRIILC